jgi:hypothetical protein
MRVLIAVLLTVAMTAGCFGGDDKSSGDEPEHHNRHMLEDATAAFMAGNMSSNVHRLAQFGSGTAEMDAIGHYLVADSGKVVLYDIADPHTPIELGSFTLAVGVLDVKVSDDGNWAFVGEDQEASMQLPGGQTTGSGGFYVYDISNKDAPKLVSTLAVGPRRGPHMVFYHNTTGGDELVFGANADISINRFDRSTGRLTELSRYSPNLVTGFNRNPDVVDVLYQGWAHDMFVMEDPVANKTLMYVANWDAGLRVVDLTNPASPVELGFWNAFPQGHSGNLHTVSTEWIGDRRITVGSVEVGFAVVGGAPYARGQERGIVYVWDTTNPADIKLLGTWENPRKLPVNRDFVEGNITSTHNLQLEQGRIYLAHYAMGIFVLDVSTPELQASPKLLAYHQEPKNSVWDIVVVHGVMYTSGSAGIISLHYLGEPMGFKGVNSRA